MLAVGHHGHHGHDGHHHHGHHGHHGHNGHHHHGHHHHHHGHHHHHHHGEEDGQEQGTCMKHLKENLFQILSLAGVALGVGLGFILKAYGVEMTDANFTLIGFPGEMLMRMLQVVTVPLIVTSVITSVCGLSVQTSRKIAVRTAAYFLSTTFMAVIVGMILVTIIKPGIAYAVKMDESDDEDSFSTVDALMDLVRNMMPQNLIQACFKQYKTERVTVESEDNSTLGMNETKVFLSGHHVDGTNTVGLIVWSFIFGLAFNRMGERGRVLVDFLTVLNEATKRVVGLILRFVPVGVLFMIACHVAEVHDWETTYKLGKFMLVVLIGLVIHSVIVLPLVYFLCVRRNPCTVIGGISPALLTAFLISSSSATLSVTFRCCEDRLHFNKRISRFMLPIGTNINMNGTALYEVVAAIFIAQLNHITLDFSQLITLAVTAAVSSVGAAGIPATGAVTTLFILAAVGLPAKEASLLVAVEWLLDRCNTVINVMGDCIGVAIIHELCHHDLDVAEEFHLSSPHSSSFSTSGSYSASGTGESSNAAAEDIWLDALREVPVSEDSDTDLDTDLDFQDPDEP